MKSTKKIVTKEYQKQPSRGVIKEKVFWKHAANLQENTHAEVRFQ